jgi:hypothetical protein
MCASGNNPRPTRHRRLCARLAVWLPAVLAAVLGGAAAAQELDRHRVDDLDYGEALYHYFQQQELAAITRLMIAEQSLRPRRQQDESRLLLADLYYGYGLYAESREMFARLLTSKVSDPVQNRIWFSLARLRYEQGYTEQASDLLARITDSLPERIEAERKYLMTNLHLANRRYQQAADISNRIDSKSIWKTYARYNLAVSVIEDAGYEQGRQLLEKIGTMPADASISSAELLALRDQANLSLGLKQLRMGKNRQALDSLSRIRLQGPLSHEALLASGWAWQRLRQPQKALLPWRLLLRRNAVDAATQEAILAIPSSYAALGEDRLALQHFEIAARQFDAQLRLLDDAVASIENDELIASLREHALLFDRSSLQRLPPSSEVTAQLHLLLASSGFQQEMRRYQQLLDIEQSLRYWDNSFPALGLMLDERRQAFRQRLPKLGESTGFARLEELKQQRAEYARRIREIEVREDHRALATDEEREHLERLQRAAESIDRIGGARDTVDQQDKLRLISGLLDYRLASEFPARFWKAKKQLIELDRALADGERSAQSLRRIVDSNEQEMDGFERRIDGQLERIGRLRGAVSELLRRQEQRINQLAIDALRRQQEHVTQLRLNARFELAKLYDKLATEQ